MATSGKSSSRCTNRPVQRQQSLRTYRNLTDFNQFRNLPNGDRLTLVSKGESTELRVIREFLNTQRRRSFDQRNDLLTCSLARTTSMSATERRGKEERLTLLRELRRSTRFLSRLFVKVMQESLRNSQTSHQTRSRADS